MREHARLIPRSLSSPVPAEQSVPESESQPRQAPVPDFHRTAPTKRFRSVVALPGGRGSRREPLGARLLSGERHSEPKADLQYLRMQSAERITRRPSIPAAVCASLPRKDPALALRLLRNSYEYLESHASSADSALRFLGEPARALLQVSILLRS